MLDFFKTLHLSPAMARGAYPLVHLAHPGLTLSSWLAFARRAAQGPRHRGGLISVQDQRGIVHALFAYKVEDDLGGGRRLRVSDLIIGRLPGGMVSRAVVSGAEALARDLGCASLFIEVPAEGPGSVDTADARALSGAGFKPNAVVYLHEPPSAEPGPAEGGTALDGLAANSR